MGCLAAGAATCETPRFCGCRLQARFVQQPAEPAPRGCRKMGHLRHATPWARTSRRRDFIDVTACSVRGYMSNGCRHSYTLSHRPNVSFRDLSVPRASAMRALGNTQKGSVPTQPFPSPCKACRLGRARCCAQLRRHSGRPAQHRTRSICAQAIQEPATTDAWYNAYPHLWTEVSTEEDFWREVNDASVDVVFVGATCHLSVLPEGKLASAT